MLNYKLKKKLKMKKIVIVLLMLLGNVYSQSHDTYLILNRFIGYNDPTYPDQIQWAPTLNDKHMKFYVYSDKMSIQDGQTYIIGDGIENSETEEYIKALYYAKDVNGLTCKVTLHFHKKPEYFHIYFEYSDWIFGYNLELIKNGK